VLKTAVRYRNTAYTLLRQTVVVVLMQKYNSIEIKGPIVDLKSFEFRKKGRKSFWIKSYFDWRE